MLAAINVLSKLHPVHRLAKARWDPRSQHYFDVLRVLAKTHDPNRVLLIERNIDNYLMTETGGKERGSSGCA
jgi:hypothetical protein